MNEANQEIAAEAALKLQDALGFYGRRYLTYDETLEHFQSAIEKALNQTTIGQLVEKQIKARSAHNATLPADASEGKI